MGIANKTEWMSNQGVGVLTSPLGEGCTIAVIGLGYVGLPLAVEFGKQYATIGYDLLELKVNAYHRHEDSTGQVSRDDLMSASLLNCTTNPIHIARADFVIVAVPTPVDVTQKPDFAPLLLACETIGRNMKLGTTIIFESTVYPGATEELCVPILEKHSGLKWKDGFHVGYSPERINPSDKEHTLTRITKVVSGDSPRTLSQIASLYETIISAGVYRANSIKVAEAAKVIENTQRDLNIALMNELAIIFEKLDIDTTEVLEAANTKWNFHRFQPGLVGGHCIGVDPYYLTHKAEMVGYLPQVILAGRRINDGMGKFVAEKTVKLMIESGINIKGSKVNVLGLTFKENCMDLRNSKVFDIIKELETYGVHVCIHDPIANAGEAQRDFGYGLVEWEQLTPANGIVLAVAHDHYRDMGWESIAEKLAPGGCLVDVKAIIPRSVLQGIPFWRL